MDDYLASVDEIELVTGEKIPAADFAKHDKPLVISAALQSARIKPMD